MVWPCHRNSCEFSEFEISSRANSSITSTANCTAPHVAIVVSLCRVNKASYRVASRIRPSARTRIAGDWALSFVKTLMSGSIAFAAAKIHRSITPRFRWSRFNLLNSDSTREVGVSLARTIGMVALRWRRCGNRAGAAMAGSGAHNGRRLLDDDRTGPNNQSARLIIVRIARNTASPYHR